MWRSVMVILGLAGALVAAGPAGAQAPGTNRLDEVVARGTLRVGLSGDYKPFSIRTDAGGTGTGTGGTGTGGAGMEGLDVDMARNLADSLGVRLELVQFAWPSLMSDLQAGRFDVAMGGITITLPRQKLAFFSTPVMNSGKTPIARCADKGRYDTLAQIDQPGVRVIANPGGTNESFDRANLRQAQIIIFPDNARTFDEVAAGRADVMITDSVETLLQQKLHPELCAVHPDHPFNTSQLAYLLPQDPVWKAYVDQWLNLLSISGDRQKLVAKWLD